MILSSLGCPLSSACLSLSAWSLRETERERNGGGGGGGGREHDGSEKSKENEKTHEYTS